MLLRTKPPLHGLLGPPEKVTTMAPKIPGFVPEETIPASYEDLFDQLEKHQRFNSLASHQASALTSYDENRDKFRDVAITLPTGRGKTLVALMIGRMHQLKTKRRVLYLSPNKHLVKQVEKEAKDLGIPARDITGSWKDDVEEWRKVNAEARDLYTRNKCIGIATYSSVFNSNPLLPDADLLILDDAHAAGEAVMSPWTLEIDREEHTKAFDAVHDLLRGHVDKAQMLALGPKPEPGTRRYQLVPHRAWTHIAEQADRILSKAKAAKELTGENIDAQYAWRLVSGKLDRTFCFLSPNRLTIRPWSPPTVENKLFTLARHRVYFSATLEEWGHIEHIFGVPTIKTVPGAAVKEPGRRLIVDAQQLLPDLTDKQRLQTLLDVTKRTLVLVPSGRQRDRILQDLAEAGLGGKLLGKEPDDDIEQFKNEDHATLVLANRYDGLNFGKGVCKHIILAGKPTAVNVHEEFTTREWAWVKAGEARARERLLQGMGRCTRGPDDHCLISLVGQELVPFIHEHTIRSSLPPRIRAELRLGEVTVEEMDENEDPIETLKSWVEKNEDWKAAHSSYDNEQAAKPLPEQLQKQLQEINRTESRFGEYLWTRQYGPAEDLAHKTAQKLEKAGLIDEAAAWYYLASIPADNQNIATGGSLFSPTGTQMLKTAMTRGRDREWFGHLERHEEPVSSTKVPKAQVDAVLKFLDGFPQASSKLSDACAEASKRLAGTEAKPFHEGMRFLGRSLGFGVVGDDKPGTSDCVWHLSGVAYFNFEAKTEKEKDFLSIRDVRQIKEQLGEIAVHDKVEVPDELLTTCVTDCKSIDPRKVQDLDKFNVVRPNSVHAFGDEWFEKLLDLRRAGSDDAAAARARVEAALKNVRASLPDLSKRLGIVLASKAIKLAPEPALLHP